MHKLFRRRANDERGAILVISTVGVVLAVVAAALAVDIGTLSQERRRDQKVADLAALDAIRDFANMQTAAQTSATRNGFPTGPGYSVTAIEGTKVNGQCQAAAGSGKVCVTVNSPHKNSFLPGTHAVAARAVAGNQAVAGFWIGSSLLSANLDDATENLPLLNRVFGRWLGGAGDATVLSYKGLADANIKLRDLQAALNFANPQQLLTSQITMGQLLTAVAAVLNNQGASSLAAYNDIVRLQATNQTTAKFKLGDILNIASGYEDKALDSNFNVFDLIAGGAELLNKDHTIDAGTIMHIPVDYLSPIADATLDTALKITVGEAPRHYFGPVGGSVKTAQIDLELTSTVDVGSNLSASLYSILLGNVTNVVLGSEGLHLKGDIHTKYSVAAATGTMQAIRCTSPNQGITVRVAPQPLNTHVDGTLSIYDSGLSLAQLVAGNVKVNVSFNQDATSTPSPSQDLDFAYSNDFTPPSTGKSTTGAPAGVTLNGTSVNTSAGAGGLLSVLNLVTGSLKLSGETTGTGVETAIIDPILNPVLTAIANHLTTPALRALGVSFGPVDVWAPVDEFNAAACGQPGLIQ